MDREVLMTYGDLVVQLTVRLKMTTTIGDLLRLQQPQTNKIHFQVQQQTQGVDGEHQVMINQEERGHPLQAMANKTTTPPPFQLVKPKIMVISLDMELELMPLQWGQLMERKHLFGSLSVCV